MPCRMRSVSGVAVALEDVADAAEHRQNPAGFRSVKSLNGPAELFGHSRPHLRQTSKTERLDTTALGLPLPTIQWPATALIEGLRKGQ